MMFVSSIFSTRMIHNADITLSVSIWYQRDFGTFTWFWSKLKFETSSQESAQQLNRWCLRRPLQGAKLHAVPKSISSCIKLSKPRHGVPQASKYQIKWHQYHPISSNIQLSPWQWETLNGLEAPDKSLLPALHLCRIFSMSPLALFFFLFLKGSSIFPMSNIYI